MPPPDHTRVATRGSSKIAIGAIVLVGVIVYATSFSGVFVFDGRPTIRDNPQIRSLTPFWPLVTSPLDGSTVEGRPVANVLSALNWVSAGGATWPFHATNLLIHLVAALLIFGILRRTLLMVHGDPDVIDSAALLAGAVATLWVVHPLNTSAVSYINQRVESLMAMFVLATIYLVLRSEHSARPGWYWAGAGTACFLAVGSKEVAVITPVLVLAFDRTFMAGSWAKAWTRRWPLYALLFCSWFLLAALVLGTGGRGGTAGFASGMSSWEYFRSQPAMITRYLKLVAWPHPLIFYYGARPITNFVELCFGFFVVGGLGLATIWAYCRQSWLWFPGLVFFASLAPSSSVIPIATEIGAEHRMYLALAAVLTVIALAVFDLLRRRAGQRAKPVFLALVSALVVVLGGTTLSRNRVYRSETALWKATTRADPANVAAWDNLGCALRDESHDIDKAISAFSRALDIDPNYVESLQERGYTHVLQKEYGPGLADLDRALSLKPDHTTARFRRAVARGSSGDFEGAIEDFGYAIEVLPENPNLYLQRGIALLNLGRPDQALRDLDQCLSLDPALAPAYQARAAARVRLGDLQGARHDVAALRSLGVEVPAQLLNLAR